MLLKSKDVLKKFRFYIDKVCVGKNHCFQKLVLLPAFGLHTRTGAGGFVPRSAHCAKSQLFHVSLDG